LFKNCPTILPNGTAKKLVLFLHGYGSNGADLLEIGHMWQPSLKDTVFLSPNAIERSEINPFSDSYQWFGLSDFNPFNIRAGLDMARPHLNRFIKQSLAEYRLLPSDLIIVGFSQGTMMALEMLFSISKLAGIVGYSGAFYPPAKAKPLSPPPVLLVHGTADVVVPYSAMQLAQTQLRQLDVNVMTKTCTGLGHSIDESGLMAGLDFITHQQQNQPIAL
jgi:phospholipase/carboxylesterase